MNLNAGLRRWPVVFVVLGLAACNPASPTSTGLPVASLPPAAPAIEPAPTEARRTYGSLTLPGLRFTHPNNSFTLEPPDGWMVEVDDTGASWTDPNGQGKIEVHVNTTGYQLDGKSLDNFIQAVGENYLQVIDGYHVLDRTIDSLGERVVTQSLNEDATQYQVVSVYYQEKDVIYESEFWMSASSIDGYLPAFERIWREMEVSSDSASSSIEPYAVVATFKDPAGLFSLDVPRGWHLDVYTQPDAVVDTFWSPDRMARIESIKYDNGTIVTKSLSGTWALQLLHDYYADDVKIAEDKVQPDGSERLTWSSKEKNQLGKSVFDTRGTTFLMLTYVSDNSLADIYGPVFDRLLQSYNVP